MPDFKFKFVEHCLYEFQTNRARLGQLREELNLLYVSTAAGVQPWGEVQHGSGPGDPVAVRGLRILSLEDEIKKLVEKVEPIERVLAALDVPFLLEGTHLASMSKLIRLWYFAKIPRDKIAELLGMSRRALYRLRCKAVELIAKYMRL